MTDADRLFSQSRLLTIERAPLYLRLQRLIREAIVQGKLRPGEALPPEREIATECGVSRVTVRKALAFLVEERILVQRHGSGTYVAAQVNRVEQSVSLLASFSQEAQRRGSVSSVHWLDRSISAASPEENVIFGLGPNEHVARLYRIRYANQVPLAIELAIVPTHFLPDPTVVDQSLYASLEGEGLRPVRAQQRLSAVNLTAEEAELLQVSTGDAALLIERTSYLTDGRVIEFTRSKYRGDAYDFVAELS